MRQLRPAPGEVAGAGVLVAGVWRSLQAAMAAPDEVGAPFTAR